MDGKAGKDARLREQSAISLVKRNSARVANTKNRPRFVWEIEWKRNIVETALARVGRKVKPKHLQIFDLYAMRHWPAGKVARELGVTRVQVYLVNHRLTKLMKREVEFLGRNLE